MDGDKTRRKKPLVHIPDDAEDAEITAAALSDPDNPPLGDDFFARAKPLSAFPELEKIIRPGRPPLPEGQRKKRVTLYLDPDVLARLKEGGKGWQTRANAALRRALGL
jgi:uncharacterized protein (DUF4415 family)